MAAFEYRQAEEVRAAFDEQGVRYLFLGKSGAILLGFPDTTQDADLFMERSVVNGEAAVLALGLLGFILTEDQKPRSVEARTSSNSRTARLTLT